MTEALDYGTFLKFESLSLYLQIWKLIYLPQAKPPFVGIVWAFHSGLFLFSFSVFLAEWVKLNNEIKCQDAQEMKFHMQFNQ